MPLGASAVRALSASSAVSGAPAAPCGSSLARPAIGAYGHRMRSRKSAAPAAARVALAPGVRVVRRGRDRLQVGITPGREEIVADPGPGADVLRALTVGETWPASGPAKALVARLAEHGLLAPAARRRSTTVEVMGDLGADPAPGLLRAGLAPTGGSAAPALLLSRGEPERELVDPWVRERRPHLVVRIVDGIAVLGPFVVPGSTACLRCIDAHHIDTDPEYVAVLHRYIHAARRDGRPDHVAPATTALALAWAARDLTTWLGGGHPATWSTTIALPDDGAIATAWRRHPECACAGTRPS